MTFSKNFHANTVLIIVIKLVAAGALRLESDTKPSGLRTVLRRDKSIEFSTTDACERVTAVLSVRDDM